MSHRENVSRLPEGVQAPWGRCDGSGPLDPQTGGGFPCGARHEHDGATIEEEITSHACDQCGRYTAGVVCWELGMCPECWVQFVGASQEPPDCRADADGFCDFSLLVRHEGLALSECRKCGLRMLETDDGDWYYREEEE